VDGLALRPAPIRLTFPQSTARSAAAGHGCVMLPIAARRAQPRPQPFVWYGNKACLGAASVIKIGLDPLAQLPLLQTG
jgi:hypothetical protein